jgi:uncharacterized protein YukE
MTMNTLASLYLWHRRYAMFRGNVFVRTIPAVPAVALNLAKADLAAKKQRYSPGLAFGPVFKRDCSNVSYRWIENVFRVGLRFIGYADDVCKSNFSYMGEIRHNGWFTDDFQSSKYRGVVLQTPAKDGVPRYLAGYECANNPGTYLVEWDVVDGTKGGNAEGAQYDPLAREVARRADGIAEEWAEQEREYQSAWQELRDAREELSKSLTDVREEIADYKATLAVTRDSTSKPVEAIRLLDKAKRDLTVSRATFAKALEAALEAKSNAASHKISWDECAP